MNELDFKRIGPPKQTYMSDQQTHAEAMSVIAEKVDEIESLKQQLAESQAVNAKLREVLVELACLGNGERFGNSTGNQIAIEALALPSDTTALNELISKVTAEYQQRLSSALALLDAESQIEAEVNLRELITKAGEVMRERCLSLREAHLVRSEAIRALPGVTLEDLK